MARASDVEQVCNILYILHRILYFLPEVKGEGTCGGGREERSANRLHDGRGYIYIMHSAHRPCCVVHTDHVWSRLSA